MAESYLSQLQSLLPPGAAWAREPDAVLTRLLAALAAEYGRVDSRAVGLVAEADPRSTRELLADWERVCGLPDSCSSGIATTLQERRATVVSRLTATGGQSIAYFEALIESLGYEAEIEEFRPFVCGLGHCGDTLNGPDTVRHVWAVRILGPRVTRFECGVSQAGDSLCKISRAEDLECLLRRLRPAQTILIFSYEGA